MEHNPNMPQSIATYFAREMGRSYPDNPGLVELVSQRIVSDGYCMTTLAATRKRDPSFADLVPPATIKVQAHRDDACRILAAIVDGAAARTSKRPREPEGEPEAQGEGEPKGRERQFLLELLEQVLDPITLAPIRAARVVSTGTTYDAVSLREYRAANAGTPRCTVDPATGTEMMSAFFYPCFAFDNVVRTVAKHYGDAPGDAFKEIRDLRPASKAPAPPVLIESDDDEAPLDADGWQRHHLLAPGASTSH
jgi:hypothetical protein